MIDRPAKVTKCTVCFPTQSVIAYSLYHITRFYKHISSICSTQGKEYRHSAKDCHSVRHCNVAVPSLRRQTDSKEGHIGQIIEKMYDKACIKSKTRTVHNKCINNGESVNWRADWSRFCNGSYAQVVKQNSQPTIEHHKCQMVIAQQAKNAVSRCKNIPRVSIEAQRSPKKPLALSKSKVLKPKTANRREAPPFQLTVKNRFSLLGQELHSAVGTKTGLNINASEYVPIANRKYREMGQTSNQNYVNSSNSSRLK